jgi:hypothetical protein
MAGGNGCWKLAFTGLLQGGELMDGDRGRSGAVPVAPETDDRKAVQLNGEIISPLQFGGNFASVLTND